MHKVTLGGIFGLYLDMVYQYDVPSVIFNITIFFNSRGGVRLNFMFQDSIKVIYVHYIEIEQFGSLFDRRKMNIYLILYLISHFVWNR